MHLAHHAARLRVAVHQLVPLAALGQDRIGLRTEPAAIDSVMMPRGLWLGPRIQEAPHRRRKKSTDVSTGDKTLDQRIRQASAAVG